MDKTIEEEVFQDKDEKLEIMKFSESEYRDKKTVSYSLDSQQMQFSPSSIPTINEATFSTDTYAVDDGKSYISKIVPPPPTHTFPCLLIQ